LFYFVTIVLSEKPSLSTAMARKKVTGDELSARAKENALQKGLLIPDEAAIRKQKADQKRRILCQSIERFNLRE